MATKKPKTKPAKATILQRKTMKSLVENGGKNVSKAMKDAGYSAAMAKNPQKLTASQGWQEMMAEIGLDTETLLKKNKDLMNASHIGDFDFDGNLSDTHIRNIFAYAGGIRILYIRSFKGIGKEAKKIVRKTAYILKPDTVAQHKALEQALKIVGAYPKDGDGTVIAFQVNNLLESKKEEYGI